MGHRACPDLPVPVKISLERLMEASSQSRGREEANTWRNFFSPQHSERFVLPNDKKLCQ